ncbi:protein FAR-RED IMPAIRED RESPONSE 1-like [Bidens hawaiensis]|uniref:protein FAR-RED IMPAIRED RESPONSE 1-like n=1 Tax=Bidens hawaiensis TaxID=980011 RepID=UPI004048EDBC
MQTCKPSATPCDTDSKLSSSAGELMPDGTLYRSLAGALQYLTFTRPNIAYAVQQFCLFMHAPREPHFQFLRRILRYLKGTVSHGLLITPSKSTKITTYSDADWGGGCPDTRRSTSVYLSGNPVQHQRTKHVELDIHFVCDKYYPDVVVNEDGTEAMAHLEEMMCGSMQNPVYDKVDFVADHPFLFAIREDVSGVFLFIGQSFIDLDVGVYNELDEERVSPRSGKICYKPVVSQSLKPVKGMVFDSVELSYAFYVSYAHASGFSVRKNSAYTNHGLLKLKYYVCSKEGFKSGSEYSTLDDANNGKRKRRKPSKITGCGAHIKLRLNADINKYEVYVFEEERNHSFVHKDDIQFLTSARRVDYVKESVIQALSQVNLGPVRAFNILNSLYGGYEQVGATKNDFKNFKTRQCEYISEYDADMVIKRLEKKKKHCSNFSFDYTIKEDGTLGGLFWADEYSKKSYLVFGDVVGFDATYRSNKYDMVFVHFTDIDNHNRNITLGAALLGSETADTYRAIQDVFPNSRHRLCMWHIWEKVTSWAATPNVAEFKEKLSEIVWTDSITTDEFKEKWPSILSEYGLSDHEWLADLYKIRKDWIPTYYLQENFLDLCVPRQDQKVMYRGADQTISCSCRRFEFFGLLCRHIFYVLRISFETEFPKKYIVRRWRKEAISNTSLSSFRPEEFGENRADVEAVLRELRFAHEYNINKLVSNKEQLCLYRDYVKDYMSKADEAQVVAPPPSRRDRFAEMTGMRVPCSVIIKNPVRTRTKGCGSHKRFKSAREIAIS